jgi:Ca2+-binding RTX toxin-like protein
LFGHLGADLIIGGEGNDTLRGDAYDEEEESRTESFVDTMQGGLGDDVFYVDSTSHVMSDDGGIDTVVALEMDWTLGAGFENLILHNDVSESSLTGIGNELDNVISTSYAGGHLEGRDGNDTLLGGGADTGNHLLGGDGDDSLVGSGGHTLLDGGAGQDILRTGAFRDHGESTVFAFSVAPGAANADRIIGFVPDADTIQLDGSVFTNVGFTGEFSAGDARFHSGAGASAGHDADDRIIYDTSTGNLWHDADGNGAGAAQLIATLEGAPGLAATNIDIVNAPGLLIQGTEGNDSLVGTGSQDTINGLGGNDTIDGGREADSMTGGAGNDVFFVDHAGDVVIEQQGGGIDEVSTGLFFSYTLPDWVENLTLTARLDGTQGGQEGHGNALDNVLTASGRSQSLHGHDGNDTLIGVDPDGPTTFFGDRGNDSLVGGAGFDQLFAGDGDDTLLGGDGNDDIWMSFFSGQGETGLGTDIIDGGAGRDRMIFSSAAFNGQGDHGAVVVDLASGTYRTDVGSGTISNIEVVTGGSAGDQLTGGAQADLLAGNGGNDTLDGGAGVDTLSGGIGADTFVFAEAPGVGTADVIAEGQFFFFQTGIDTLRLDAAAMPGLGISGRFAAGDERFHIGTAAAEADDRVIYNSSNGQLFYDGDGSGAGAAALIATINSAPAVAASDIEVINGTAPSGNVINGTAGADTLSGTAGNDIISGLGGNDLFLGGSTGGADTIDGGAGRDSIEFKERATSAITVDFVAGTVTGGSSGTINFTSIERVLTGNFNDTLTGNGASQTLTGQGGADTLWGAGGTDTLWGGTGADAFVFREMGTANADRISDFASGSDKLHLDDAAFGAIGAMGNFAASDARFKANSSGTATDTNDRVVFNTSTGQLYYDADGSGSGAALQLIATVQTGATVAATDIVVI